MFTLWAMNSAGIKARTVTLGAVPAQMAALNSKQIEAAIISPTPSYRIMTGKEGVSIFDFGKAMPPTPSCYVASQALIDGKPEALRKFLKILSDTIIDLQQNEATAIEEIKKYTKDDDAAVVKAAYEANIKTMDPYGVSTDEGMKASLDLNVMAGLGQVDWPVREIYTNAYSPKKP
jgi:ABC-type nitrate/sulfonate/bicarbonate transport system substrate-binding protein